jgi:hypothetical protein
MKPSDVTLSWVLLTVPLFLLAGCGGTKETKMQVTQSRGGGYVPKDDERIPKELLDPEFLKTLDVTIWDGWRLHDVPDQPLEFSAGSPQSKQAGDLLVWLVSLKDVERRPPFPPAGRPQVGVEFRRKSGDLPLFVLDVSPGLGYRAIIWVYDKPDGAERGLVFVCDERILTRVDELWQSCSGVRLLPDSAYNGKGSPYISAQGIPKSTR